MDPANLGTVIGPCPGKVEEDRGCLHFLCETEENVTASNHFFVVSTLERNRMEHL